MGGAHQHGQDIGGGEDDSGVLLRELVDDGILGGGDISLGVCTLILPLYKFIFSDIS